MTAPERSPHDHDKPHRCVPEDLSQGSGKGRISRELEAAFQIRGPDLRRLINSLRGDGVPICSSASGYYYAGTEEELRRTIRQLRSRIKKIAHAERGLTKALEQSIDSGQISLPLEGGDTA